MSEKQYVGFTTKTSVFVTRSHVSDAAVYTTVIFFSEYELDFLACFFPILKNKSQFIHVTTIKHFLNSLISFPDMNNTFSLNLN